MKGFIEGGLYIHMPFCREKCLYCDFYSVLYTERLADSYISVILKQIRELNQNFSSIYIGGGTPSVLSHDLLDKLLSGFKRFIGLDTEFTIEVNPESVDEEKLKLFFDKGVNRISIGIQSFDDKKLKSLGRIHGANEAIRAIELSQKTGVKNINIDMMFGVSGESIEVWRKELKKAADFDIHHISCYCLSYEKNTAFFRMREKKDITALDDETIAGMYAYMISYLPKMGFEHYEVSNFAKPGFECAHNLNYWDNNSYIGLGPSAVSYIDGVRFENIRGVEEYINRFKKAVSIIAYKEKLSDIEKAKETASVKIRTKNGIDYKWFKNRTGFDFDDIEKDSLDELFKDNLLEHKIDKAAGERIGIMLTEKGFLFSDTVSSAFL